MNCTAPPFRADHVGSLLRPPALKDARATHAEGSISDEELRDVEDGCIRAVIKKQEDLGLQSITDGEFRRAFWHFDFLSRLDGVDLVEAEQGIQFKGVQTKPLTLKVNDRLGYSEPVMVDHFRFVQANTERTAKQTIPSPSVLHFRGGRRAISTEIYPGMEDFFEDLGGAYQKAVQGFANAGCRYLQLDETNIAYLCDPEQVDMLRQRGEKVEGLLETYAKLINTAIAGRPDDMTISMHLCRGNFRSTWIASGGYEPVAEVLFNGIDVDAYFMEYDTDRAGKFEPLRFVPPNKTVVLGLVTTKTGALESKDEIKRRIEEAAKFVPLERLALSPQCGFASTEEGNLLSYDDQWAKLAFIVEVAREVWGDARASAHA